MECSTHNQFSPLFTSRMLKVEKHFGWIERCLDCGAEFICLTLNSSSIHERIEMNWKLQGYKTYAVGILMIIMALLKDPIDTQMIVEGIGFITLRAGVAKL